MKLSQLLIENVELDFTGLPEEFKERLLTYPSHYQEWGIREIKKGEHAESILDAIKYYIEKVKDNRYKEILRKVTPEPKNILTLTLRQVEDAQQEFERTYAKQSKREIRRQLVKGYTTTLVDEPGLKIIKVEKKDETDGAAKIAADLVGGAHWCVVNVKTGDEAYLKKGPLYFIYLGDDRYLCHFPTKQLMNVDNKPFRISEDIYNLLAQYIPDIGMFINKKKSRIYKNAIMKYPELAYQYAHNILKRRWPEAEPYIMKDPRWAYFYARDILKRRWPESEPYIMEDPKYAYEYAYDVLKRRWPEAEPYIMQNPEYACNYADNVINRLNRSRALLSGTRTHKHEMELQRWSEAEPYIIQDPKWAYEYASNVIRGIWPEAEPYIMKSPEYACKYAHYVLRRRWSEAEPYIMKSPEFAYYYTINIIQYMGYADRWPEAEPYIMKDPESAYKYARFVLKRRWPEAEPYIVKDPGWGWYYAMYVIKGRWPEAEPYIMKDPYIAYLYAYEVLKRRWPEAEPIINRGRVSASSYKAAFGL